MTGPCYTAERIGELLTGTIAPFGPTEAATQAHGRHPQDDR